VTALPVFHHDTIDSTNFEAQRLAARGDVPDCWIRSDQQTNGRGRGDHQWISPSGNLYATLLLTPGCERRHVAQLSLVVGLSVHDVLTAFIDSALIKLKWPNDCLVDDAKVSGILVDSCQGDTLRVAIGCGINVAEAPTGLAYRTACIREHAPTATVSDVFDLLRKSVEARLAQWDRGQGFAWVKESWQLRSYAVGTRLSVNTGARRYLGQFAGLSDDGALLLEQEAGDVMQIYAGDVGLGERV
jgi:BirA family transcriptional regulator, biotin operon repressor / biotin---[acetyl-CoA-carboxylase] ligase